jgi:hypothetical protein
MTPTVKIKVPVCDGNAAGEAIINESDYNPKVHTLVGAAEVEKDAPVLEDMTKAELREFLDGKGIAYHADDNKTELLALAQGQS